jgi:hypothetical protein
LEEKDKAAQKAAQLEVLEEMSLMQRRLERFYTIHNQDYVSKAAGIVAQLKGNEAKLNALLHSKYSTDLTSVKASHEDRQEAMQQAKLMGEKASRVQGANRATSEPGTKTIERAKREAADRTQENTAEQAEEQGATKAKREAAEQTKKATEEQAKREAAKQAQQEAEEQSKREKLEKAKKEAQEQVKQAVAEQGKRENEEQAKREATEKANREAEKKAKREAEEQAKREAAEQAKREAAEQVKREAEKQSRKAAEEQARKEAEEQARKEAEEQARKEAEEQSRKEAEEQARKEAKQEAEEQEAEEQAKREAEEQQAASRVEHTQRVLEQAQESAKKDAEAQAKRHADRKVKKAAEAQARKEAEVITMAILGSAAGLVSGNADLFLKGKQVNGTAKSAQHVTWAQVQVSRLQVSQFTQIYRITNCCLPLSALRLRLDPNHQDFLKQLSYAAYTGVGRKGHEFDHFTETFFAKVLQFQDRSQSSNFDVWIYIKPLVLVGQFPFMSYDKSADAYCLSREYQAQHCAEYVAGFDTQRFGRFAAIVRAEVFTSEPYRALVRAWCDVMRSNNQRDDKVVSACLHALLKPFLTRGTVRISQGLDAPSSKETEGQHVTCAAALDDIECGAGGVSLLVDLLSFWPTPYSLLLKGCTANALPGITTELVRAPLIKELVLTQCEGMRLPLTVAQFAPCLQLLDCTGSGLVSLPSDIGSLPNLWKLALGDNQLTTIPASICRLTSLKKLLLDSNQLEELPKGIGHLTALALLNLSKNQLTKLPPSIVDLRSLDRVDLSHNQIAALPEGTGWLAGLKDLTLHHNKLTELPAECLQLPNLKRLFLQFNLIQALPSTIGQLSGLEKCDLQHNKLAVLPESIGQMQSLRQLRLNANRLTALPKSFGNLSSLNTLALGNVNEGPGNPLGALPPVLLQLCGLKRCDMSGCALKMQDQQTLQKGLTDCVFQFGK